ncbi:RagB/SusD family nutrient uptake outer membrane protein [Chitinophaga sp. CB10]|uniref:RagB/SusD family nutrient uptake outer membrane protein n=1 Tax=Chitinophaga sp. CB10 TaxID=1891659 RepID=UPI0025C21122|nr:RagB/SusD family nutrient uptake outer membrane protein [Chitinophaga sp. CB10]
MKHAIYLLLAALSFTACSRVLEEKPQAIAEENFYNSPAEVQAGLNAIYKPIRQSGSMSALYQCQLEIYTEYMYGRGSHAPLNDYAGLDNTNITRVGDMWAQFYEAIRNANIVIKKIPTARNLNAADAARFTAEARFMRGLLYFHLVRNWGGVPLRAEENMAQLDVPRATTEATYQFLLADLLYAADNLTAVPRLDGAPSKWSASAVLADVYMNLHDYTKARDAAAAVINSGKYALVQVATADDYDKIFGPDVQGSPEEVFYLKFSRTPADQGFNYPMYAHYPNSGYYKPGGYYTFYSDAVQNKFVAQWDKNDLRYKYNWYVQTFGLTNTTILNKKFSDKVTNTAAGNDFPMYRYADIVLFYAECLARAAGAPDANAMEMLNQIRRRAYGKPTATPDPAVDFKLSDYSSLDAFISLVVRERTYENCSEAKHWFDLKRLGIVKQVIKDMKNITVADKHLLWPIPTNEYNYNKAIDPVKDQNPGY